MLPPWYHLSITSIWLQGMYRPTQCTRSPAWPMARSTLVSPNNPNNVTDSTNGNHPDEWRQMLSCISHGRTTSLWKWCNVARRGSMLTTLSVAKFGDSKLEHLPDTIASKEHPIKTQSIGLWDKRPVSNYTIILGTYVFDLFPAVGVGRDCYRDHCFTYTNPIQVLNQTRDSSWQYSWVRQKTPSCSKKGELWLQGSTFKVDNKCCPLHSLMQSVEQRHSFKKISSKCYRGVGCNGSKVIAYNCFEVPRGKLGKLSIFKQMC